MRLGMIWTLRGMALGERVARTREAFWRWLAHRLPRPLAFWSFVDTGVRHLADDEVVPEVPYMDLLQRAGDSL